MPPALTVQSPDTIPKAIHEFLGLKPGERVRFEPLPDGRVAISPFNAVQANTDEVACRLESMVGSATSPITTDELVRLARGDTPFTDALMQLARLRARGLELH